MTRRLTYDFVKSKFMELGCTLLSTEYVNNHTKLDYICINGHEHSITWNDFKAGYGCMTCAGLKRSGEGSSQWKGGVSKSKLPLYETYAPQLEKYQLVYKVEQEGLELLGVECTYCHKLFIPPQKMVQHRLDSINGKQKGEANFYCSYDCKKACPVYRQILWPKYHRPYKVTRPNQGVWAILVKERDDYTCQRCGNTKGKMIAHHIDPVINNPVESLDIDNGVTLCKKCHKHVHRMTGCTTEELKC